MLRSTTNNRRKSTKTSNVLRRHASQGKKRTTKQSDMTTTTTPKTKTNENKIGTDESSSSSTTTTSQIVTKANKKVSKSKQQHKGPKELTLDSFTLATLPTPHAIIIGEELQDEEEKQFKDAQQPLRTVSASSFSFDLPQMSRLHVPTVQNINAINNELTAHNIGQEYLLKLPQQSIPNWSKLTKTEQLLLQAGFIALVPGSSNYTYLPMAMRVLDKLINIINDEMLNAGSQKVELPSIVEKQLLDEFQLYRQRMVQQNESIHSANHSLEYKAALERNKKMNQEQQDADNQLLLAQSPYEHQLSPYYRFYNLQDEELIVSPPLIDYYTNIVKNHVKLANQLPLSFYQFSKKLRDVNDQNALLNASTNISPSNQDIGYLQLDNKNNTTNDDDNDGNTNQLTTTSNNQIQHHAHFRSNKSHQTDTLMNGLITATEYHTLNTVTYHPDADDAHAMYKHSLELFNRLFRKLGVQGVQVEADGGRLGAELSHEYHLIIGPTSEAPSLKVEKKGKKYDNIPTNTHGLVQCGLCNYTANTENAQFRVSEVFDQATYNARMKSGDLTRAMRQDPRSFGIFEATGGDQQFDRDIRSKVTGLVKQMLPHLARRDVPMVANVVKLLYAPGQDGYYDIDVNSDELNKDQLQFVNHAVLMLRADREFNPRAIARHFGCYDVELLPAAESALLLLKFQKFKQKQYQDLIQAGAIEAFDPNFNIFSELHDKALPVSSKDVEKMYENMNDVSLLEKEQRRLRRLAAKRDVNAGLAIICDNTLAASGIDLDDEEMMDEKFLDEHNQDRSFGLKLADKGSKNQSRSLVDRLQGFKTEKEFQASHHVPPEFAKEFEIIFKGIKEGILNVTKDGDIILNNVPDELKQQFPEFMSMPADASIDQFKRQILQGTNNNIPDNVIDAEVVNDEDINNNNNNTPIDIDTIRPKRRIKITRKHLEAARDEFAAQGMNIDDIDSDDLANWSDMTEPDESGSDISENDEHDTEDEELISIIADDHAKEKSTHEIFESAMEVTKRERRHKFQKEQMKHHHDNDNNNNEDEESTRIDMYQNDDGDLVDKDGNILPHITADLEASPDVRRAFGKRGYEQLDDNNEFAANQGGMDERFLSAINPSQGDFTAPQSGDKCIQSACQSQGMLEGMRSIEIGKTFFLSDSITRNTDAVVFNNKPTSVQGKATYKKEPMHMTSTKIGITRLMHALIESGQYDEYGLKWPELIAPYQIAIISDTSIPVNFGREPRTVIDERGRASTQLIDTYEYYLQQAEFAEEEYLNDLKSSQERLKTLRKIPGITPALDKQRNILIDDVEELIENQDSRTKLQFGYWSWGLADNHSHSLNIAATIAKTIPNLEDDLIYDDRHHMSISQRIQDTFSMGIPWVIVIDDLMQEKGLMKVINRAQQHIEHLSVDQIMHFFNGQRPLHQRPEHHNTDFERQMKYRVENAIMGHFGQKAMHKGDSEYFRLQPKSEPFDYNTHVDVRTSHDEDYDKATTPRFDENNELVLPESLHGEEDETRAALRAQDEASKTGEVSDTTIAKTATDENDKSQLLDDTIEETIKSLNARGEKREKEQQNGQNTPAKKGRAIDEWYLSVKKLRRRLPPPTADELDRMFRVGILYKDAKGTIMVNELRALQNMHVVYGVEPHVVDQYERGNLLDLDRSGVGVKQVIDKDQYLLQQRQFTAQRIEKQIESGFFDIALTPEKRAKQMELQQDYEDWSIQEENKHQKKSIFKQIKYDDPHLQFTEMHEQRREDLKTNGVTFRKIKDGSAVVHRIGSQPEAKPLDVRYDTIDPTQVTKQQQQRQQQQHRQQQQPYVPPPPVPPRQKKSISDIFKAAPVQQPREGELYEEVFGPNDTIKKTYGEDTYESIFGNKKAR